MSTLHRTLLAASTALLLIGGTLSAQAASATTTGNANVRSGAGSNFHVIATIKAGTRIEIGSCRSGWCELSSNGKRGYISQSLLRTGKAEPQQTQQSPKPQQQPQDHKTQAPKETQRR